MGKQLSIYLDEQETKRLAEIAQRECRRPVDQVRYLLRLSMGLADVQEQASSVTTNRDADHAYEAAGVSR